MPGRRVGTPITRLWSGLLASVALLVAVIGVVALAFFLPARGSGSADPRDVVAFGVLLATAVVVAVLARRSWCGQVNGA